MVRIKNTYQLAASKRWLAELAEALDDARSATTNLHPRLRKAQLEGITSQIRDLKREIREYEAARSAPLRSIAVVSLDDLPDALVRVRIARQLTQEDLAAQLGVKPQQVQKLEAGAYQRASFASIVKVARLLGIHMEGGVR